MGDIIHYDNEKDLRLMVDDIIEFILVETQRLVKKDNATDDPNYYLLISQNLTQCLVLNLLNQMRLKQESFLLHTSVSDDKPNHLPINGPDFFRGMKP